MNLDLIAKQDSLTWQFLFFSVKKKMDQHTILGRIGEGAHGIVLKAKHIEVFIENHFLLICVKFETYVIVNLLRMVYFP